MSCDEASALSREDGEADLAIQHIFLYKITSGFITPLTLTLPVDEATVTPISATPGPPFKEN
jgi:hypothetical protein